jgi:amino acid transporter
VEEKICVISAKQKLTKKRREVRMKTILFKNIYFCIIVPMIISGLTVVGFFYAVTPSIFSNGMVLLFGGMVGYLVGFIIRGKFKWEKNYMKQTKPKTNDYMKKGSKNTPKTSYNNNYMKHLNTPKTNK